MSAEQASGFLAKDKDFKVWDTSHRKPCTDISKNVL